MAVLPTTTVFAPSTGGGSSLRRYKRPKVSNQYVVLLVIAKMQFLRLGICTVADKKDVSGIMLRLHVHKWQKI